jgi:hypothetical protein
MDCLLEATEENNNILRQPISRPSLKMGLLHHEAGIISTLITIFCDSAHNNEEFVLENRLSYFVSLSS